MSKAQPSEGGVSLHAKLQEKRRAEALDRQKHARHKQLALARLAAAAEDVPSAGPVPQAGAAASAPQHMDASGASHAAASPSASDESMPAVPGAGMQADTGTQSKHRRKHKGRGRGQAGSHAAPEGQQREADGPGDQHMEGQDVPMQQATAAAARRAGRGPRSDARTVWSQQLQQPEWMTDVPADLADRWLVLPRPEGPRCVVSTARGLTVVRNKAGSVLLTAHTALPEGGPTTVSRSRDFCVLDAVWHGPNNTLYVLDLLVWRGYALYDCTAEFRAYWLQSKLSEDPQMLAALSNPPQASAGASQPRDPGGQQQQQQQQGMEQDAMHEDDAASSQQPPEEAMDGPSEASGATARQQPGWARVVALPVLPADPAGLQAAYQGGCAPPAAREFQQDGLYFVHKDSHYQAGATTPLALSWKDAGCSAWPLDTDAQGGALPHQQVVLAYRMDSSVATADEPPVVLGNMPLAWVQAMGPKLLQPGRLLRFSIRERGILWAPDGRPAGADLHYEGLPSRRRGQADTFSKVLFQYMARTQPLTWQHILAVAQQGHSAAAGGTGQPDWGTIAVGEAGMMIEVPAGQPMQPT